MSSHDLGIYLKELINDRDIKITELAKRSSLSRESIYKLLRGDVREPDLSTLVRISRALSIHPIVLLRKLFNGWEFSECVQPDSKQDKDAIGFLGDITYPDNSIISVNTLFTKVWKMQNLGSTHWRDRQLKCTDNLLEVRSISNHFTPPPAQHGLVPTKSSVPIPDTPPGGVVTLSVEFRTPAFPCSVISYWKMVDCFGDYCFPEHEGLSCLIQVVTV